MFLYYKLLLLVLFGELMINLYKVLTFLVATLIILNFIIGYNTFAFIKALGLIIYTVKYSVILKIIIHFWVNIK